MRSLRRVVFVLYFVVVLGGLMPVAEAQVYPYGFDTRPPRGFMPTADQVTSPIDSIDAVTGKLHLQIPLGSLPQRRAGLGYDLDLVYDSHLYDMIVSPDQQALQPAFTTGGWSYNFQNYKFDGELRPVTQCQTTNDYPYIRMRVSLPDGSLHVLHRNGETFADDGFYKFDPAGKPSSLCSPYLPPITGWLTYYTTDGSFLKVEIYADGTSDWYNKNWYLYFPNGQRVVGNKSNQVETIYDSNSNAIHFTNGCSDGPACNMPHTIIYDDTDNPVDPQRAIHIYFNVTNASLNVDPEMKDEVTAVGPLGPALWTLNWQAITIGGTGNRFYGCSATGPNCPLSIRHWVLKYLQLPLAPAVPSNQTPPTWNSYSFGYSDDADWGYGEVDQVRIPSGAQYSYHYRLAILNSISDTENIAHYNSVDKKTITHDGVNPPDLQWTYTFTNTSSTITNPDTGVVKHSFYDRRYNLQNWFRGLVYRIDQPNGAVRKRAWAQNRVSIASGSTSDPNNPYIQKETVTVGNAQGASTKTAVTDYAYDKNGNLLQRTEYGWVNYAGVYNGTTGIESGVTANRVTNLTYHVVVPAATTVTDDLKAYWHPHFFPLPPASPRRLDAIRRHEIVLGAITSAATEFDYDDPLTKGNVTAEKRWDSVKSPNPPGLGQLSTQNAQVLSRSYGDNGDLRDIFEPEVRTHITEDPDSRLPGRIDYAYGTALQRSWTYTWNAAAGTLTSKTDLDNATTTSYAYDVIGRQTLVEEANLRRTSTGYDDVNGKVLVQRDLATLGDGKLQTITHYDQLGRVRKVRTSDGTALSTTAETDGIKVTTTNRMTSSGVRVITSTPYRNVTDPTVEWTCTQYDRLGRPTAIAMFKGSTEPTDCQSSTNRTGITQTTYDADRIQVIDPAGSSNRRDQYRDALGRMTRVVEAPTSLNYSTIYQYDPLDHLLQVTQIDGSITQTRNFNYSSLGRLRSAANPENGTTTYTYFDSGAPQTRTDARGWITTFSYDDLHRPLTTTYANDGGVTPAVAYEYYGSSASSPNKGQLKSVTSSAATTTFSDYDALGRIRNHTQRIAGNPATYALLYTYWLNDEWKTVRYPSGRLLNYSLDDAGRVNKAAVGSKTYADLTAQPTPPYYPDGRVAWMKFGNDLWATNDYRPAGTPTILKLGTAMGVSDRMALEYNYAPLTNNGNLVSHVIRRGADFWKQEYTYDAINRLLIAKEWRKNRTSNPVSWTRTNGYDRFGNRWVTTSGLTYADTHEPTASTNFNKSTNRLNGLTYDSAGNLLQYTPYTLNYDAESRLTAMASAGTGNASFSYDGVGRRVKKVWTPNGGAATTTYYVYDASGRMASEYSTQAPTATDSVYPFTDLLGSVRAVSGEKPPSGTASVTECYDYLEFGRLLSASDNQRSASCYQGNPEAQLASRLPQKFTGKERDAEIPSHLDYFGARYFSGAEGRFASADQPLVDQDPSDPQSWNLYSYVRNNPLKYIDPTGQDCVYTDNIDSKGTVGIERGDCSRKHGAFVNGTLDINSITYDSSKRSLGYSYATGSEGTIGAGVIDLSSPGDELDAKGLAFATGMAARVDASNRAIAMFAAGTTLAGVGAGAYPVAAQAANELALGSATGRLFFEGKLGYDAATAYGIGRLISDSPLGRQYYKWGEPLGRFGWGVLSRFWASGASGTANIFPSFTNPHSILWTTELQRLYQNPNVFRIWH